MVLRTDWIRTSRQRPEGNAHEDLRKDADVEKGQFRRLIVKLVVRGLFMPESYYFPTKSPPTMD